MQNLTVSGNVSGDWHVGGVVGYNDGGTVTNCAFTGSVSGNNYVGGVVGYSSGGSSDSASASASVTNCYNTGSVTSSGSPVGGVVGYNSGIVTNCYNTGSVTGTNDSVGGVVGHNSSTVENCYNTGTVTGTYDSVGGVVGWNSSSGTVTNCYNTGAVSGGVDVGGVVGYNSGGGNVTDCYFLQQEPEISGIGGASAKPGAAAVDDLSDLCEALEDSDTWTISPFYDHPVLKTNPEGGDGTAAHPYEIKTADQLETFRDLVNGANNQTADPDAHAKLMNNIDLSSVCGESNSWTPIGNSIDNSYEGTFNGDGHTISGLYIYSSANDQGLFGYVGTGYVGTGGTVQNLSVSGSVSVSGYEDVGGIVGYNFSGTVTNCAFSGSVSVSGSGDYVGGIVGGIVGYNSLGTVTNCAFSGSVSVSGDYVGGIVGSNHNGSVENCYNTGTVTGTDDYVGGVVGWNSGNVKNCYYQQHDPAIFGIGDTTKDDISQTAAKSLEDFHSGEVAWLLENGQAEDQTTPVWGQSNLNTDKSWPTLVALDNSAQPVYQVTFDYGDLFTDIDERFAYSYTNGVVSKPTKNPELDGHTLSGWYSDSSLTTAWDFSTVVTKNMTLYAQWTAVEEPDPDPEPTPEPEPEEPPYTGKYSYEVFTSVGDNGAISVDRYATEGDKVTITVTPDEAYKLDDLTVTANGKDVELTAGGDGTYTFTMPSADVKITATFAEDPNWEDPEAPSTDVSDLFIDIAPDAWYKDAVQYAYDNGLMTGTSANEFAPEQTTTRAMIVSILARLENVTTAQAAGFADVDDEWYATAVNWAANVGVVNGYEDNTFQPNTAITREQLAAILMNYAAYKGYDVSARADLSHYSDADSISSWANDVLLWAVAEGLLTGVTDDTIAPQAHATRAQVAAILQRFLSE